jgi:hypothetical protein
MLRPLPPEVDLYDPRYRVLAEREAIVGLAGSLAALKHCGQRWKAGLPSDDLKGITYACAHVIGPQERLNACLDALASKTWLYLDVFWDQVEKVADALLRHQTLSGQELATLLRR